MLWPNGTTTQPTISRNGAYGPRDPRIGVSGFHAGVDFIGFSNVHAAAAGKVTFAAWLNNAAGNTVYIDAGGGTTHVYMHLRSIAVRKGQQVTIGQRIGIMGATGNASAVCLHFEVRTKTGTVNPLNYLRARVGRLVEDGIAGPQTLAALNARLIALRIGGATVEHKLQNYLNQKGARDWQGKRLTVDGVALRNNWKRRVPLVGRWRSIYALQAYLGTTRDGHLSRGRSAVIEAMQRRLNRGTF